jgi:hypothetical protein
MQIRLPVRLRKGLFVPAFAGSADSSWIFLKTLAFKTMQSRQTFKLPAKRMPVSRCYRHRPFEVLFLMVTLMSATGGKPLGSTDQKFQHCRVAWPSSSSNMWGILWNKTCSLRRGVYGQLHLMSLGRVVKKASLSLMLCILVTEWGLGSSNTSSKLQVTAIKYALVGLFSTILTLQTNRK